MDPKKHIPDTIALIRRILTRIEDHAGTLQEIQWDRGRRPTSAHDAGTRQRGGKPDPTGETATDLPRLGVRDALKTAHEDLDKVAAVLLELDTVMVRALERWEGDR